MASSNDERRKTLDNFLADIKTVDSTRLRIPRGNSGIEMNHDRIVYLHNTTIGQVSADIRIDSYIQIPDILPKLEKEITAFETEGLCESLGEQDQSNFELLKNAVAGFKQLFAAIDSFNETYAQYELGVTMGKYGGMHMILYPGKEKYQGDEQRYFDTALPHRSRSGFHARNRSNSPVNLRKIGQAQSYLHNDGIIIKDPTLFDLRFDFNYRDVVQVVYDKFVVGKK